MQKPLSVKLFDDLHCFDDVTNSLQLRAVSSFLLYLGHHFFIINSEDYSEEYMELTALKKQDKKAA